MLDLVSGREKRLGAGWKILAFLLVLGLVNGLAFFLMEKVLGLGRLLHGPAGEPISALLLLGVSWAALRLDGRPLASLGLRLDSRWARELAFGILAGFLLILAAALLLRIVGGFTWALGPAAWRAMLGGGWMFLFVAISEEMTFRGYPFQRLVEGLGPWSAQALFAALFALIHWGNPGIHSAGPTLKAVTTLNIALAAILLGLAYLRTRSLALPIGIHWAWNWTQGSLLGFSVSGTGLPVAPFKPLLNARPDWITGGPVGLEGSAACTLVCLAFIGLLLAWRGSAPEEA